MGLEDRAKTIDQCIDRFRIDRMHWSATRRKKQRHSLIQHPHLHVEFAAWWRVIGEKLWWGEDLHLRESIVGAWRQGREWNIRTGHVRRDCSLEFHVDAGEILQQNQGEEKRPRWDDRHGLSLSQQGQQRQMMFLKREWRGRDERLLSGEGPPKQKYRLFL